MMRLDNAIGVFQSTLSMRRATQIADINIGKLAISIHALHEESDDSQQCQQQGGELFQSTLSMRRATKTAIEHRLTHDISIHALHEESDSCRRWRV